MSAIISVEDFEREADQALVQETGKILQSTYKGYGWGVRSIERRMIQIILLELVNFGGLNQGMVINPKDWETPDQFVALVKKMGGELLERSGLSRTKSYGIAVDKRPEGFQERFDTTARTQRIILK